MTGFLQVNTRTLSGNPELDRNKDDHCRVAGLIGLAEWLAGWFLHPPTAAQIARFQSPETLAALGLMDDILNLAGQGQAFHHLLCAWPANELAVELQRRHTELFQGIFAGRCLPPYASFWDGTGHLYGPAVERIMRLMTALDVSLQPDCVEAPDHLGVELLLYAEALRRRRSDLAADMQGEIGQWTDIFIKALIYWDGHGYYGQLARFLEALQRQPTPDFSTLSATPAAEDVRLAMLLQFQRDFQSSQTLKTGAPRRDEPRQILSGCHWGIFYGRVENGRVVELLPWEGDPDPSPQLHTLIDRLYSPARIHHPMVRRSWLEQGPGAARQLRGNGDFVRVSWDQAFELIAGEMKRIGQEYGEQAIFAGSCGWKRLGRLHDCRSLLHRMLKLCGFSTRVGTSMLGDPTIAAAHFVSCLLSPGKLALAGQQHPLPQIKMAYWAGGNPFSHHRDSREILRAWRVLDTAVVQECQWTATARHADIVLPATTSCERNDIEHIGDTNASQIVPMARLVEPLFESRHDFEIFAAIAERFGQQEQFTRGRSEMDRIREFYEAARGELQTSGRIMPDFAHFWEGNRPLTCPVPLSQGNPVDPSDNLVVVEFSKAGSTIDPNRSGEGVASNQFFDENPPHPTWLEPDERYANLLLPRRLPER